MQLGIKTEFTARGWHQALAIETILVSGTQLLLVLVFSCDLFTMKNIKWHQPYPLSKLADKYKACDLLTQKIIYTAFDRERMHEFFTKHHV